MRLRMILAMLCVIVAFTATRVSAQPPTTNSTNVRLDAVEKTLDRLFTITLYIPGLAALVVVLLEVRSWLGQREELKLARTQQKREHESVAIVDNVMRTVHELLAFQAELAKQTQEAVKRPISQPAIEAILGQVQKLRKDVTRHNLYAYDAEIIRLSERIEDLELFFRVEDFQRSIACHYVRGLAGLLQGSVDAPSRHFAKVGDLIAQDPANREIDDYIEPMSLYFRGIHLKNLAQYSEAREDLERALRLWPQDDIEVRTHIELAEVVALQTGYDPKTQQTSESRAAIDELRQRGHLNQAQERNLARLEARLLLIEGNYAHTHTDLDKAIACYEEARGKSPDPYFERLSLGIALLLRGTVLQQAADIEYARRELQASYDLILQITHPEARGRILLGASAIIAAKLTELGESFADYLLTPTFREIDDLLRRSPRTGHVFHVFSPLTKRMHALADFKKQLTDPKECLQIQLAASPLAEQQNTADRKSPGQAQV